MNMLRPGAARKFSDYANQVFIPFKLYYHSRDTACQQWMSLDEYFPDSLKAETRSKRGNGVS